MVKIGSLWSKNSISWLIYALVGSRWWPPLTAKRTKASLLFSWALPCDSCPMGQASWKLFPPSQSYAKFHGSWCASALGFLCWLLLYSVLVYYTKQRLFSVCACFAVGQHESKSACVRDGTFRLPVENRWLGMQLVTSTWLTLASSLVLRELLSTATNPTSNIYRPFCYQVL